MNLLKSLMSVSFITLISRILGFIRDILIASTFGASMFTDAFFVSFKIPNLFRRIFSDGAFSQAFIPVLMEYKSNKNKKYMQEFISSIFSFMIFILLCLTMLGMFFSHFLILVNAPGFLDSSGKLELSKNLLTIMFPYILFVSLSSFFSSILNSWNYFAIPALSPIFLNISIIIFSVFFSSFFYPSIISLAWAVIIGGFLQLFYQCPFLYRINMLVKPNFNWKNIGLIRVLKNIVPSILGTSANQISLIINTIFSSLLNSGSISWIYYADRLIEFPIGILGVSLNTILFTSLTKNYKKNRKSEYKELVNWGFRIGLVLSVPSSLILFFLAKPIIIVLFQYGKFTYFDVLMTEKVLKYYSCGLISFILVKILSSVFYSCEKINIPMKFSLFTLCLTQLMNPFLIFYFKHAGLALSISISSWIHFLLLYSELYKRKMIFFKFREVIFIFNLILSTLVMILVLFLILNFMPLWNIGSFFNKIMRLIFVLFVSGIVYLFMLNILGIRILNFSYNKSEI
ncbi:MAG: murein biosynthesis integral membrane protein MurJ [Buchnera aphidicola (Brevicoryne brassicae)]|uniref:Probable lipid II flippase MurJ n=1 Tax=Buchnera aphidicola (Brevicoryne brassicae) TaxID=911343 RepID=A0AAJ5PTW5_9GAMM|nr:murein biosynthesis integral membrane protein MurJ [Buchnera aphidicola]QCI19893.1 murein biosynthesis integral membrane protein MurJ [Buchnera aphidicola (Brevicoryne brassicae)]WAI18716.1 MAG: murein biosynthesis integral membrane protein MurJ [Buchnera aphidicola (Brevicoryne brassicae)]